MSPKKVYYPSRLGVSLLCVLTGLIGAEVSATAQMIDSVPVSTLTASFSDADTSSTAQDSGDSAIAQITTVSDLLDVQPTDWAFQALQNLIETYGCLEGYPDSTFRGNRPLSRFEFAVGLNACLSSLVASTGSTVTADDLVTMRRLQDEFASELSSLETRITALESDVTDLHAHQFSTTTKLNGEAVLSLSEATGGADNQGTGLAFNNRLRLNLSTSFTGKDLLLVGLQSYSYGGGFDPGGTLPSSLPEALGLGDPVFGTASNVSLGTAPQFGLTNPDTLSNQGLNNVSLYKLLYVFPVASNLTMFVGPDVEATDAYPAISPFANDSQGAVSRFATADNAVTRISGGTSGIGLASAAGAIWDLSNNINLTAFYASVNAPLVANNGLLGTPSTPLGAGVFGGSYVLSSRLMANLSDNFKVGINYAHSYHQINILGTGLSASDINSVQFTPDAAQLAAAGDNSTLAVLDEGIQLNSIGATMNWQFSPSVDLTLSGSYIFADLVNVNASTDFMSWLVGLHFNDVFREGNSAGIIFGQPLNRTSVSGIAVNPDNADPYHLEGYINFHLTDRLSITPGVYAVFNPESSSSNATTVTGVLRTTYTF